MIPEHRLATLLDQLKQYQISKCLYHNSSIPPSLFSDHMCDRNQFPLRDVLELTVNGEEVWFLQFSHNGRKLAASGEHPTVVIYDTVTFQVEHTLTDHAGHVPYLAWSPDDSKLITCSHDHKAIVWDAEVCAGLGILKPSLTMDQTGRGTLTIDHHAEPVTTVAWAPDGETFVTASLDKQTQLCLWDVNGGLLYTWSIDYRITHCAISLDGQRLVTLSIGRQIYVYNFVTREEQYRLQLKSDMTSLSISRDSRYMLINMTDNEVHMIDIETAIVVRKFTGQKQGKCVIRSTFGGADEKLVLSGSEGMMSLQRWDLFDRHVLMRSLLSRLESVYMAHRKRLVN